MTDRFVNREPAVRGIEHQIVPPDLHRLRREFLRGFLGPLAGVAGYVALEDIFPAASHRRGLDALPGLEVAEVVRAARRGEEGPAGDQRLRDDGPIGVRL